MSSCEKCWVDHQETGLSYTQFLKDREAAGRVCTPEQQAGADAGQCPVCERMTEHMYTRELMCGCTRPAA
jgi:hypothetical protein